jgi:hypothetical protein
MPETKTVVIPRMADFRMRAAIAYSTAVVAASVVLVGLAAVAGRAAVAMVDHAKRLVTKEAELARSKMRVE